MLRGHLNHVLGACAPEVRHTIGCGPRCNLPALFGGPEHLVILSFQANPEVGHNTLKMLSDRVSVLLQCLEGTFHVLQVGLVRREMKVSLSKLSHKITDLSPIHRNSKDRFVESERQHDPVKP